MSENNPIIVKDLDPQYAIALGFCTKEDPDTVYDNEAEAREANGGNPPSVGFVIVDKETGHWADFATQAFAYFDGAMQCYSENVEQAETESKLLCVKLDEKYAVALHHQSDPESEMCLFCFFDLEEQKRIKGLPEFETCTAAFEYYEEFLKDNDGEDDGEPETITDFTGGYAFLNNGYDQADHPIYVFGKRFRTAEAAFQSQKDPSQADRFTDLSGRAAKRLGATVSLRKDWDVIKDLVMSRVLSAKFSQDSDLLQALEDTGDALIEPHNTRHDNYWGSCQCAECIDKKKENRLGIILMCLREDLGN